MRDFRDAKTMAQTLRETLSTKSLTISHSESLELVSRMFGLADWNTLSAILQATQRDAAVPAAARPLDLKAISYPAIPLRDMVPFPTMSFPIFVGREKSMRALDQAFKSHRRVVLAVQRNGAVDEPGLEDVYEIGVLAKLIQQMRVIDRAASSQPMSFPFDAKVFLQADRRILIRRFRGEMGTYEAEIAEIDEGPIPDVPERILGPMLRFEKYLDGHQIQLAQTIWPPLRQTIDPGRLADIIASHLKLPISEKHGLLATLDSLARLEKVDALMVNNP